MANNRMFLICNVCHPEIPASFTINTITPESGAIHLAKWYPGGMNEEGAPYYRNDGGGNLAKEFLNFLDIHKHGEIRTKSYRKGAGQPNPVRIEYESEDMPILK